MAFRSPLYGGAEMEGEVRDVIGIEPYGGGMFDEALEMRFVGHVGSVRCVADGGGGRIVRGRMPKTMKKIQQKSKTSIFFLKSIYTVPRCL